MTEMEPPVTSRRTFVLPIVFLMLLSILSLVTFIYVRKSINLEKQLNFNKSQSGGARIEKIKRPSYNEKYDNKTYNFTFKIAPLEEKEQYKEWNPYYSFEYIEENDYRIRIYRINQDALTNSITATLTNTYEIYPIEQSVKSDLLSWARNNNKINKTDGNGYEITTFSKLPCLENQEPQIQVNPVLIMTTDKGHAYYYMYFDFGKPFILGYAPGHDMACNNHLTIDTIHELSKQ